ncbi:GerAB/ArcD/ProY family transporter [Paenibacillus flagellatus]|uniref:Spore gernimation protein n=1 Tax=Paenibacillus flagellatus TaxID=2211139 RepID=A0A2V5JZL9_9BACL|nr:GerAB/ArcD/ProY family transporter [Paenibacillus flagellatus]PYI52231.1 spore gernimation protein [Paenibacillus flagellatus]
MNKDYGDRITATQAAFIVAKSMIGTGILVMSRGIARDVGTPDGWISVIVSGFLAILAGVIIVRLSRRFPGETFFEYSQSIVGKPLGVVIGVLVAFDFIARSGYLLRLMGEVVRVYLLDKTPMEVVLILFLSLAAYLTTGGLNPIARLIEICLPIVVLMLMVLILFSLRDSELVNIRPVLGEGVLPVLRGIKASVFSFSGFEIMLFLLAFMKEPDKAMKSTLWGIAAVIPLYAAVVGVTIAMLTVDEVKTLTWPTMSVAKNIELPGGFFERFESVFSVLWVISMYTAFVLYQYVASLGFSRLFRKNHGAITFAILPIIYIVSMLPRDLNEVFRLGDHLGVSALIIIAVIPPLFWLIAKLRGKGIENA